ncbi:tRNA (adenosine(37)-N6)-threonylcarbamoyltransferase complex dimerization subunit type 1 TsaB [Mycoplasmopsis lipofaciens]|uniref:tRNA (adenosine(37)-N6)-threonylcarbamoyltransferase complex dimerization subunit type 1 TsaB n=1 Tax=Mycoplasmopsis lipofaciens TaxID=114884 RepID=UPI000489CC44|nr:tRNA (adenosine(37)-N6)-threonylcarbamoyltransferase complex dimerization subunit type 1 TsaB [Mycoplasmopsis lipofaciens]
MKLYLDTANNDFVVAIFDNSFKLIKSIILKNYTKKVQLIPKYVEQLLIDCNYKITDFDCFYTNLGPGFFTGVRISLVYLRTLSLILKNNLKTISTMQILSKQNPQQKSFSIDARGGKYYYYQCNKQFSINQITLKNGMLEKYDKVNYYIFLINFNSYESLFQKYDDIMNIEPYYIKKPQIGVKK